MIINIDRPQKSIHPVLNLGFRIFFLGSAIFAIITMLLWHLVLNGVLTFHGANLNPVYWHAHEMIFGYALAVIAGFLLTAVKAWTGVPMPSNWRLLAIFMLWALARIYWALSPALPSMQIGAMTADVLFWLAVSTVVVRAVLLVRQTRQMGIVAKLLLLLACHCLFDVGVWLGQSQWQSTALYLALFLVIGVVFTIGRRVLPFFIEKGIFANQDGTPSGIVVKLPNSLWLDRGSLLAFLGLSLSVLLHLDAWIVSILASLTAIIHAKRLMGWYHRAIWQKPLLWSLYVSFWVMVLSLLLMAILPWLGLNSSLGLHALALSGIGMTTIAMMARVSLGHTGRNIHQPPKLFVWLFVLMVFCLLLRVFVPMWTDDYVRVLAYSQACWVISFALFLWAYTKMLISPRIDGIMG